MTDTTDSRYDEQNWNRVFRRAIDTCAARDELGRLEGETMTDYRWGFSFEASFTKIEARVHEVYEMLSDIERACGPLDREDRRFWSREYHSGVV